MGRIVIIPCGHRKRSGEHRARDLYTGPYFKSCLNYALSIAADDKIFILSGKYGLLGLDEFVISYDVKMGDSQSITCYIVQEQAGERGIILLPVIAIGGKKYTNLCRKVWENCLTPLDGVGGMGKQMQWMKKNRGINPEYS